MSNGGFRGLDKTSSVDSSPGRWSINEVFNYILSSNWPSFSDPVVSWIFSSLGYSVSSSQVGLFAVDKISGAAYYPHTQYGSTTHTNTVWYWQDIKSNATAQTFSKGSNYSSIGVGAYFDGLFWAVGGTLDRYHDTGKTEVYSFNGSSHTQRTSSPVATNRLQLASDGTTGVYMAPGWKYNPGSTNWYRLPSTTGNWQLLAPVPISYVQATACDHANGKILFTALYQNSASSAFYMYDIASNTWSAVSDNPFGANTTNSILSQDFSFWLYLGSSMTAYSMRYDETSWSAAKTISGSTPSAGYGKIIDGVVYDPQPGLKTV